MSAEYQGQSSDNNTPNENGVGTATFSNVASNGTVDSASGTLNANDGAESDVNDITPLHSNANSNTSHSQPYRDSYANREKMKKHYAQKSRLENELTDKHVNFNFNDADVKLLGKLQLIETTSNTTLDKARLKLEALLENEMAEHNEVRLEVLFQSMEDAIRGDDMLIPEDILEYATYLVSNNDHLRDKAYRLWRERLTDVNTSKFGELRRPCNGDLFIDAFCDLIINNDNPNDYEKLVELMTITGKITSLRHGFTRLMAMYTWSILDSAQPMTPSVYGGETVMVVGEERQRLALQLLDVLIQSVRLQGPEVYLHCPGNSPLVPDVTPSRMHQGWAFTCWMRLDRDQTNGVYDILHFQNVSPPGHGLRIGLEAKKVPHIGSLSMSFILQSIPIADQQPHNVEDSSLTLGRWHFVAFSHVPNNGKFSSNFQMYIDGEMIQELFMPFPNLGDGLLSIAIGGFRGDLGQAFLYESSITEATMKALYATGPTYNPPVYCRTPHQVRVAAFPRNIKQRAAPMSHRNHGYILIAYCYSLDPRACSEVSCLPRGWGMDVSDRQGMDIITNPHNKSSVISMGGICYIFYLISPEFRGPPFVSDKQVVGVMRLLNELISENLTLLRQLFTMGLGSIKQYILKYVSPQLRSHLVLNVIKELLILVEKSDQDRNKVQFVRGFSQLIMDVPYWIRAPRDVGAMLAAYIHTLVETRSEIMVNCVSLLHIFDMVRQFFPNSFPSQNHDLSKVPNDADVRVAKELLESAAAMVRLRKHPIKLAGHRALSCMIDHCVPDELKSELLSTYSEMCMAQPEVMFGQMSAKPGLIKVLSDCLHLSHHARIRIKAAKILMGFIKYQKKQTIMSQKTAHSVLSHTVNKAAISQMIYSVGLALGALPSSMTTYTSLLEIVLGKFRLQMPSLSASNKRLRGLDNVNNNNNNTHNNNDPTHDSTHSSLIDDTSTFSNASDPTLASFNPNETPPLDNDTNDRPSNGHERIASLSQLPIVSDKDQITLSGALEGLIQLIIQSNYPMKTRQLMDLLSLVKTNDHNQKMFCRQRHWDKWVVSLISLEMDDDALACNQLVAQITSTLVWRFLMKDDKGASALMRLLIAVNLRIRTIIKKFKSDNDATLSFSIGASVVVKSPKNSINAGVTIRPMSPVPGRSPQPHSPRFGMPPPQSQAPPEPKQPQPHVQQHHKQRESKDEIVYDDDDDEDEEHQQDEQNNANHSDDEVGQPNPSPSNGAKLPPSVDTKQKSRSNTDSLGGVHRKESTLPSLINTNSQQAQSEAAIHQQQQALSMKVKMQCRMLHEFLVQVVILLLNRFLINHLQTSSSSGHGGHGAHGTHGHGPFSGHNGHEREHQQDGDHSNHQQSQTKSKRSKFDKFGRKGKRYITGQQAATPLMSASDNERSDRNDRKNSASGSGSTDELQSELADISANLKPRVQRNLTESLDIAEWILFNHRFSMLCIPRIQLKPDAKESDIKVSMLFDSEEHEVQYMPDETRNEQLLLKRLLICTLKFVSFKNERQLVLRRLLRYLKEILPHKACNQVFGDCISAAREFYHRLRSRKDNNLKTMRIAYSFLKNAHIRYFRRNDKLKAPVIRALQEDIYAFWGPTIFADNLDPNTAQQMISLDQAETSLEQVNHHIHSLWVFLQHQKYWEYKFQDERMKKFRIEYIRMQKETKNLMNQHRGEYDNYIQDCIEEFGDMNERENERISKVTLSRRRHKRDIARDLKKYMEFFDEEYQCRFPDDNTPEFWELDPRETENHTRLLLVRNFKGTDHADAAQSQQPLSAKKAKLSLKIRSVGSNSQPPSQPATPTPGSNQPTTPKPDATNGATGNAADANGADEEPMNLRRISVALGEIKRQSSLVENKNNQNGADPQKPSLQAISESNHDESEGRDGSASAQRAEQTESKQAESLQGSAIVATPTPGSTGATATIIINEDDIQNEDWNIVDEEDQMYQKANIRGKIYLEAKAINISPFFKIVGTIYITDHHLIFEGHEYLENVREQNEKDQIRMKEQRLRRMSKQLDDAARAMLQQDFREQKEKLESSSKDDIIEYEIWSLNHIKSALPRRYLLRENGIEIWIAGTRKSFFFTFESVKKRMDALSLLCKYCQRLQQQYRGKDIPDPRKLLRTIKLTERWQRRQISNFDYLMELNVLAGRSYNDITQYPVFPWVLNNFHSQTIDINDPSIYRDLSRPIGALNEERLQHFIQRYEDSLVEDIFPQPFFYGTHYMSAGIALHYLCRIEPFTTLAVNLQAGRFDLADRLFHSISNAWDLSLTNVGDVKEVVPEIYYFSEFLRNINSLPLGVKQDGNSVNHVTLPPWAENSPEKFVKTMRDALESEYVSEHINEWIDLIFGYKQLGEEAKKAYNLFFYLTYAGAVDADQIEDPSLKAATEQQIYHFGQCPNQLFESPHPKRLPISQCNMCEISLPFDFRDDYEPVCIRVFDPVEQPSFIKILRNGTTLKVFDTCEKVVTFELPLLANLDPNQPPKSATFRTPQDATQELPKFELLSSDWSDSIVYQTFVVSDNGLYGVTGGYLDASIKVHSLRDGQMLGSVTALENGHNDLVTCLCLSDTQDILVTGAKDGSVVHWTANFKLSKPGRSPLVGKPYRLLSIHFDAIRVIAINTKVGVIVSAADDATIALYSIARKRFIREVHLEGRDSLYLNNRTQNENLLQDAQRHLHMPLKEIINIHVSDSGYIIIHSLEDTVPHLRVLSLNGILIKRLRLNEILFAMRTDITGGILITGGQAGVVTFRRIFDLSILQEIVVLSNSKPRHEMERERDLDRELAGSLAALQGQSQPGIGVQTRRSINRLNPNALNNTLTVNKFSHKSSNLHAHSPAWRAQRMVHNKSHSRNNSLLDAANNRKGGGKGAQKGSKDSRRGGNNANGSRPSDSASFTNKLQVQRQSLLDKRKSVSRSNGMAFGTQNGSQRATPRASTHFKGRFSSVDGTAILSSSRIIDLDLDPDNTFMVVAILDVNEKKAEMLLYPLPNTRHLVQFDRFVHSATKVLHNAKETLWDVQDKIVASAAPFVGQQFISKRVVEVQNAAPKAVQAAKGALGMVKSLFSGKKGNKD